MLASQQLLAKRRQARHLGLHQLADGGLDILQGEPVGQDHLHAGPRPIDRLADAIGVAHRSARIALQSVVVGLGLSVLAMIAAAFGFLPPLQGALLQEAIDIAVILNALRALRA